MRKPQLNNQKRVVRSSSSSHSSVMLAAFCATLLASNANAGITLPSEPLTTGARVPPNILFILDDSGSMSFDAMPEDSASTWTNQTYVNNTVYYNPYRADYTPWVTADGKLMTGGTSYNAVYGDFNLASGGTIDLANTKSCRTYNKNTDEKSSEVTRNGTQVCGGVQTFYVPINRATTKVTSQNQVYRYQILTNGEIYRSEYLAYSKNNTPSTAGNMGCATSTRGDDWRNCTRFNNDFGRTEAQERVNYATWFSYHRTRMKAAKAGAGIAFNQVGVDVRVGFRTIWGRNGATTTGNWPTQSAPIPVGTNDGLFDNPKGLDGADNNRNRWYQRLYGAIGYNGTPLHKALDDAGKYYSSNATNGPYGPEIIRDQLTCRQNFTILTTDGYWNNLDIDVGEQDNSSGSTITDLSGKNSYRYQPSAPYAGGSSNTLADVAMKYWKADLRTDLDNNVRKTEKDPAFWQHMVTFGISLGLAGNTGYGSVASVPANFSGWPNPMDKEDGDRIDDLLHAAVNGHGEFVSAADPDAFVSGLTSALAAITGTESSFSNLGANSVALSTTSKLFQARYLPGAWTGEVGAYRLSVDGAETVPVWEASKNIPVVNRKLFTSDGTRLLSFPAGVTATQLAALTRTGGASNYPVTGAENAAYLAGSRTLETRDTSPLRKRDQLLGDIVGSSPAYVAETNSLYVGANDGMLHAFDADSGAELFGFIPNGINWNDLGSLSRPDYTHRYFVDGPIVVSSKSQTPNKNILVGALGKGGKGLFSLDVTTPSNPGFKWEIGASDPDMGLVQSAPIIARLNDGTTALIVSNGLNSANGHAVLFVYNLDTGALIRKIDTGRGSAVLDAADSNALSAPTGWDVDGNGTLDYVYAGDMLGNVWKFDLTADIPATWGMSNGDAPIFSATYEANGRVVRQPITGGLAVAMNPNTYKTWIFFGTGRLMTTGDMEDLAVQSMYGFVDDGSTLSRSGANANLTRRTAVVAGTSNGQPVRAFEPKSTLPALSKGWYLDLLTPAGYVPDGERVVSSPRLQGNGNQTVLVVSSVIPTASACEPGGKGYVNALDAFTGTSLGAPFFDTNKDGSFADEVLTSGDGKDLPIGSVDLGVGMGTVPNLSSGEPDPNGGNVPGMLCVTGSEGKVECVPYDDVRNLGRVSWREIKREG